MLLKMPFLNAFEIETHANISHYSYQQTNLFNDQSLISDLGLDLYDGIWRISDIEEKINE